MTDKPSGRELAAELEDLRARLAEAEEVLRAIRNGEVDAVLVAGERGEQVYALSGADRISRQIVEAMNEGAVTLSAAGNILYCNAHFAKMLGRPFDQVLGSVLRDYLPPAGQETLDAILAQARTKSNRGEVHLQASADHLVPVYLSASRLQSEEAEMIFCLVLTDLTEQKSHEQIAAAERLASLILGQAVEPIVVCDEQGRVIRASQAAQRFCHGSPLMRPFAEVFPLRTGASGPFDLAPVLQGETQGNVDVALDRQGQKFDLILNAGPLLSGRQVLGCVVTLTDITERKRAEEALRNSEERYRVLFESAAEGILAADVETRRLKYANPAVCRAFGYTAEEFTRLAVADIHPKESLDRVMAELEAQARGEKALASALPCLRKDGTVFYADIVAASAVLGGRPCLIGFFTDITDRRRAEEERNKTLLWQQGINLVQQSLLAPVPLKDRLRNITDSIVHLFGADFCRIWLIRPGDLCERGCVHAGVKEGPHICRYRDRCLHLLASSGRYTHMDGKGHRRVPFGAYKIGRIASGEDHKFLTNDARNDPRVHNHEWARELGLVSFAGYQLHIPDGETLGVLALFAKHPILPVEDALLDGLSSALAQAIQQTQAEEALRDSEIRYRMLFEASADGVLIADIETKVFKYANPALCRMFGYTEEELRTIGVADIHPKEALQSVMVEFEAQTRGDKILAEGLPCLRKDGTIFYADVNTVKTIIGGKSCNAGFFRDITERKRAEEERESLQAQFLQAQKMEAVGRLAGGVAHDFNNMLGVILGNTELAMRLVDSSQPIYDKLTEIRKATQRSADLIRQLLAFARKQTVAPRVLDLNATVESMLKMLRQLIGEDINLAWLPQPGLGAVEMDPAQIDQILANLCVNARDAIAGVGKVTIETENAAFDEAYCADHAGFVPGQYVLLAFSDDGCGMDKAIQDKIFDPFFTTKEVGKGTGLGLPTVYGIVKQNNGFINVYSEPNKGTTFKIYLPRCAGQAVATKAEGAVEIPKGHGETILLVEDEPAVLKVAVRMLEDQGYAVLSAPTPDEAVTLASAHAGEIHLLITDVVMPEMNGRELALRLHATRPAMKCLFMSGYTATVIARRGTLEKGMQFIQKPFSTKDLAVKVRAVLDTP